MTKPILTIRQQEVYDFLKEKILARGYGPTIREIAQAFGFLSPNGVMCHLQALERKGWITRDPMLARAIKLTDQPSPSSLPSAGALNSEDPRQVLERGDTVDFAPLFDASGNFALTVTGDALAGKNIVDGDTVILKRATKASNGDIVLATVDGQDAVLRVYSKEGNLVRLEATGKTKAIVANGVTILGKVVGVIRKL